MKVFVCYAQGSFCGGMILVSANTALEAYDIAVTSQNTKHLFDTYLTESGDYVTDTMFPQDKWMEFHGLEYKEDSPKVLAVDCYIE